MPISFNGQEYTLCSPHSFINKKLPPDAPIDVESPAFVGEFVKQVYGHGTIAAFNSHNWSSGIYLADENTPRYTVTIDRPPGQADQLKGAEGPFFDVPIPDEARPAPPWPGDNHMVVYSPVEDSYWEMWKASQYEIDGPHTTGQAVGTDPAILNLPGWHCEYGGAVIGMKNSPGYFDNSAWNGMGQGWGARATKLQLGPGLISRYEGLNALNGVPNAIPHAVHFACPYATTAPYWRWPAQATDGAITTAFAPQEGMMLRLPANYDLSSLQSAHPFVYALCVAIRDYGMVLADTSGTVAFYMDAQGVVPGTQTDRQPDVWLGPEDVVNAASPPAVFDEEPFGNDTNTEGMLQHIPWSSLLLLDASYRPTNPVKTHFLVGELP